MHNHSQFTDEEFKEHLEKEHRSSLFSDYLKEIVYGGNDGIVTTFAVVAGFTGAYSSSDMALNMSILTVLLFGLANLFADGTAMGLGNFLSLRAEQHIYQTYKEKERLEIQRNPEMEKKETLYILKKKGFSEEHAFQMTELLMKNPDYWLQFMMTDELEMKNPEGDNPAINGLATFLSFCVFGCIPIIPYLFVTDAGSAFLYSCLSTLIALVLLGIFSGVFSGRAYGKTIFETVLIGSASAFVAYFVGTFFS